MAIFMVLFFLGLLLGVGVVFVESLQEICWRFRSRSDPCFGENLTKFLGSLWAIAVLCMISETQGDAFSWMVWVVGIGFLFLVITALFTRFLDISKGLILSLYTPTVCAMVTALSIGLSDAMKQIGVLVFLFFIGSTVGCLAFFLIQFKVLCEETNDTMKALGGSSPTTFIVFMNLFSFIYAVTT